MTSSIEIDNMGETIEIVITDSTTASDVVGIVNGMRPGTARLRSDMIITECVQPMPAEIVKEQKRKQKSIDRIAWEGERRQRYQKGMQFK